MKRTVQLLSPAKINLFLRIKGKRPDGYHEISTLMQTISLADTLTFALSDSDYLTCTDPEVPLDGSNLILRALSLFRSKTNVPLFLRIHLDKHIPMQSGLGGGSSNAATALWAANILAGNPATLQQLTDWSGEIGSDVPFFFSLGTAHCTGRGEQIENKALETFDAPMWIVKPPVGCATASVYKNLKKYGGDAAIDYFQNDLEEPALMVEPSLAALKQNLLVAGFEKVCLSGSGSAFVCLGHATPPPLLDHFISRIHFLTRPPDHWYSKQCVDGSGLSGQKWTYVDSGQGQNAQSTVHICPLGPLSPHKSTWSTMST